MTCTESCIRVSGVQRSWGKHASYSDWSHGGQKEVKMALGNLVHRSRARGLCSLCQRPGLGGGASPSPAIPMGCREGKALASIEIQLSIQFAPKMVLGGSCGPWRDGNSHPHLTHEYPGACPRSQSWKEAEKVSGSALPSHPTPCLS